MLLLQPHDQGRARADEEQTGPRHRSQDKGVGIAAHRPANRVKGLSSSLTEPVYSQHINQHRPEGDLAFTPLQLARTDATHESMPRVSSSQQEKGVPVLELHPTDTTTSGSEISVWEAWQHDPLSDVHDLQQQLEQARLTERNHVVRHDMIARAFSDSVLQMLWNGHGRQDQECASYIHINQVCAGHH
jgi:hypothetical protein